MHFEYVFQDSDFNPVLPMEIWREQFQKVWPQRMGGLSPGIPL